MPRVALLLVAIACAVAFSRLAAPPKFTPLRLPCGALEPREAPALVAEEVSSYSLASSAFALYDDGLLIRRELHNEVGPSFVRRTLRSCLSAAETAALLAQRDRAAAEDRAFVVEPKHGSTMCIVHETLPLITTGDHFKCERSRLATAVRDAAVRAERLEGSCPSDLQPCAIDLSDRYHGSAHDPNTRVWGATLFANGRFRCELRDPPRGGPMHYVADEGRLGAAQTKAMFAQLLDGVSQKPTAPPPPIQVPPDIFRGVALLPAGLDGQPNRGDASIPTEEAIIRQRFAKIAAELGPRCVPPR